MKDPTPKDVSVLITNLTAFARQDIESLSQLHLGFPALLASDLEKQLAKVETYPEPARPSMAALYRVALDRARERLSKLAAIEHQAAQLKAKAARMDAEVAQVREQAEVRVRALATEKAELLRMATERTQRARDLKAAPVLLFDKRYKR